jgi:hypothetical protein
MRSINHEGCAVCTSLEPVTDLGTKDSAKECEVHVIVCGSAKVGKTVVTLRFSHSDLLALPKDDTLANAYACGKISFTVSLLEDGIWSKVMTQ